MLRDEVQRREGAELVALMVHSIGGANGLVCATWAARLGLPLLDADVVGRTFPSLAQTTTAMAGIPTTPLILTDGRGNIVALDAGDNAWAERLARRIATSMGGVCAAAVAPMTVQDAQRSAILGSITRAVACGADPDGLGRVLAEGHIGEIEHRAEGEAIGISLTLHAGPRRLRLEAQSELLLALEDGLPRAAVPDVLALVDAATGAPLLLEHLRAGQPVRLLLLDGPPVGRAGRASARRVGDLRAGAHPAGTRRRGARCRPLTRRPGSSSAMPASRPPSWTAATGCAPARACRPRDR